MKRNKILALILALTMALSLCCTAFADLTVVDGEEITTDGGTGSVPVELEAEAARFSVTVPSVLPIDVDADGVVSVANNAKIVNESAGAVKVTNLTITGINGWETADFDTVNMATEKVGSKKVAMVVNNHKTTGATWTTPFVESEFPVMAGMNDTDSDELVITYDAKVPAQATSLTDVAVASIVFTVGWDLADDVVLPTMVTFSLSDAGSTVTAGPFTVTEGTTWDDFFTEHTEFAWDGVNSCVTYTDADTTTTYYVVDGEGNEVLNTAELETTTYTLVTSLT